ncbi:hypothetical protein SynA1562_01178 [Synechococcus sp. A15-62]|nr:hypothetical protein SynA1562_01178 [Synechococcus sp. A15-62]
MLPCGWQTVIVHVIALQIRNASNGSKVRFEERSFFEQCRSGWGQFFCL